MLRRSHQLADGLLGDTEPLRDCPVTEPLSLQCLHLPQPLARNTPPAPTPARLSSQPNHPVLRVAILVSAHRALGDAERPRDFRLLCGKR